MKKSNHEAIRHLLDAAPLGMTVQQIAERLGKNDRSVCRSLMSMPDAYIRRWSGPTRGQYSAVWCCVQVPPNAPHPLRDPEPVTTTSATTHTRWVSPPPWLT